MRPDAIGRMQVILLQIYMENVNRNKIDTELHYVFGLAADCKVTPAEIFGLRWIGKRSARTTVTVKCKTTISVYISILKFKLEPFDHLFEPIAL